MGLKFNGRRILQSSFIRFMGRSCSRVLFNARVVWQRIPDYLYNAGDQITEWTGGWQQKDTYMAHNDYWFGNTPGAVSGLNGQLTINADCCFSKRMRKVFKKNEKSMLQFCNKNSKKKRAFTMG